MTHQSRSARTGPERPLRDEGFTLIEVTVALAIAVVLLVGLTMTLGNTLRAVRHSRSFEQATSLAIERIEYTRSLKWENLSLAMTVQGADPLLLDPVARTLDGYALDLPAAEVLVEDPGNGWVETYRTEEFDEQEFDVNTYVTEVTPGLRRVVVVVYWEIGTQRRDHVSTALISSVSSP